jgi:D-alanyl-D-alanine carboxypeptidase/D-alanyl-D-alanine-endopeptidase (penicillin-binding protein 4)
MNYSRATGRRKFSRAPNNANPIPVSVLKLQVGILLFCILLLPTAGCAPTQSRIDSNPGVAAPESATPTSKSLAVKPDQKLSVILDSLLNSSDFSHGRWGVAVISVKDGKLIYEHNSDHSFTPASNMKVYTTAVALDLLGADYQWRTSVYADAEPDPQGIIRGDLVLYGRGAPDLITANQKDNSNSIEELANRLATRGIKHIQGNVVGDESYFRGDATGDGWQWNDLQWYFGAEASALTINANSVEVSITPATKIEDQPEVVSNDVDGYVQLTNKIVSVARSEPLKIGVQKGLSDNNVTLWGQYPVGTQGYGASISVHRPSLWAASILLRVLKSHGISVAGTAQSRDSRVPERERFNPEGKHELAFVTGNPLGEIIKATNKFSVNLYAELLLRTVGRERAAMLSSADGPGREVGDDERGVNLVRLWLTRQGIKTSGLAIHDGSGLSRLDLITPRATVELLESIHKTNAGGVFTDSLPVAATDGTLRGRLEPLIGRVSAKTGALTYDNSLSGYLTASDRQVFAFSVICNDFVSAGSSISLIDRLVLALAEHLDNASGTQSPTPRRAKQ